MEAFLQREPMDRLKQQCRDRALPVGGNKADLIARLLSYGPSSAGKGRPTKSAPKASKPKTPKPTAKGPKATSGTPNAGATTTTTTTTTVTTTIAAHAPQGKSKPSKSASGTPATKKATPKTAKAKASALKVQAAKVSKPKPPKEKAPANPPLNFNPMVPDWFPLGQPTRVGAGGPASKKKKTARKTTCGSITNRSYYQGFSNNVQAYHQQDVWPEQGGARRGEKFVVWTLQEYPPDGFHSYQGPSEKEFHSYHANKKDANAGAKAAFQGHMGGLSWPELEAMDMKHSADHEGLSRYKVFAPDGERVEAGVAKIVKCMKPRAQEPYHAYDEYDEYENIAY